MRASMISAAVVAALVGYGSTIALVVAAAQALGATPAQTVSWACAIALSKAAGSAFLSWRSRVPVVLAWSTPGAALIGASQGMTMAEGVGAFLLAGALTVAAGTIRPLGRAVAAIPDGSENVTVSGVAQASSCPGDPAAIVAASAKARKTLGWEPKHDDLHGIVTAALNWERKLDQLKQAS